MGMLDLISSVKFNKRSNEHLERMKKDVAKIGKEQRVFVSADKTSNLYLVEPDKYRAAPEECPQGVQEEQR